MTERERIIEAIESKRLSEACSYNLAIDDCIREIRSLPPEPQSVLDWPNAEGWWRMDNSEMVRCVCVNVAELRIQGVHGLLTYEEWAEIHPPRKFIRCPDPFRIPEQNADY